METFGLNYNQHILQMLHIQMVTTCYALKNVAINDILEGLTFEMLSFWQLS